MEHEYIDDGDSGVSNRIESIDDLESKLLEQFRIMGTNDKDVLIGEFQKLLGGSQNYTTCQFFLEMNNWFAHTLFGDILMLHSNTNHTFF